MKKFLFAGALILLCAAASAQVPASTAEASVSVNPAKVIGPIKYMNAVNNGPNYVRSSQVGDNFDQYKACNIPFARTHDSSFSSSYGGEHTVDISAIFPDFSKDVNDPKSYDFKITDRYLSIIQKAGTKVFFRLGQKIEHQVKKYNIYPPKDYKKWAQICEHIIRHYNEGWAEGFQWNIEYWEIWNEPDLDWRDEKWKKNPRTWGGSPEDFFKFYEIVANHLNKLFPDLKIGGPACAGSVTWTDMFLKYMSEHKVAIDFYSWHVYYHEMGKMIKRTNAMHDLLVKYGYTETESILNEWNYVKNWTESFQYSKNVIKGVKGASYCATTFNICQNLPVDMLMYYDARVCNGFDGLFDSNDYRPLPAYYSFYSWSKLAKLGTQVEAVSTESDVTATAASSNGRTAVLVSRFNDDNNVVDKKFVNVKIEGLSPDAEIITHFTDSWYAHTEIPAIVENGMIKLNLEPNAVVLIEIR